MRAIVDHRDDLVKIRTQTVNRLHVVLTHLVAGGAARNLTADRAADLLRGLRTRDPAAKTLRALATDLISEVRALDRRITKAANDIQTAVAASGTTLTDLYGAGTLTAAKILAHVGDVARFRSAAAFATYTGTAPIEVSSGDVIRHRLSRAGDRQLNYCLHVIAITQVRQDTAVGWYRRRGRLHTGDPIAMAADATSAYISARAQCNDAAVLCDTWEIADAINARLHSTCTDERSPCVRVARDQVVRTGDIIISRSNDATITVHPGAGRRRGERIDQVRNGNRWRVAGVQERTGRIAAERLSDRARVLFEGDYVRDHITLGYATTLHAAQGVTVGDSTTRGCCFTVLSEHASRAMAYVGMTRGKDENHAFIYQPITGEADHQHGAVAAGADIHTIRRGTKYAAAHHFRMILAHDDRPRTMHVEAERTDRDLLPPLVAALLDRNDQRRNARRQAWRAHSAQARARQAAYERIMTNLGEAAQRSAERARSVDGDGLEL